MEFSHIPVMKEEVISGLNLKDDGIYVDGTVGGGGHSFEILSRTKNARIIAFDKDEDAIRASGERLRKFGDRVTFVRDDFKNAPERLTEMGITKVDGVLLDLGVSSYQLDNKSRGFSFSGEARLDMRMDNRCEKDAYMVVNNYSEKELVRIFNEYGEEKFARKIALNIVIRRNAKPIETTTELAEIIDKSVPHYKNKSSIDNQRRIFQAIRIEVNGELAGLEEAVISLARMLKCGGRIAVLTFHSLEDRAVKNAFQMLSRDCVCPPKTPVCICGHKAELTLVNRKPIQASKKELEMNSRSSSAKLRVAERL